MTDLILRQDGFERPWKRTKNNLPDTRAEKALRRFVEGIVSGDPDYDEMGPEQVQALREQLSGLQPFIGKQGQIKSFGLLEWKMMVTIPTTSSMKGGSSAGLSASVRMAKLKDHGSRPAVKVQPAAHTL